MSFGTITVHEGKNLAIKDPNGSSDPYCIIGWADDKGKIIKETKCKTKTIQMNLNPVWEEELLIPPPLNEKEAPKLKLEVFDEDFISRDDFMGCAQIDYESMEDGKCVKQWYPLVSRPGKNDKVSGSILLSVTIYHFGDAKITNPDLLKPIELLHMIARSKDQAKWDSICKLINLLSMEEKCVEAFNNPSICKQFLVYFSATQNINSPGVSAMGFRLIDILSKKEVPQANLESSGLLQYITTVLKLHVDSTLFMKERSYFTSLISPLFLYFQDERGSANFREMLVATIIPTFIEKTENDISQHHVVYHYLRILDLTANVENYGLSLLMNNSLLSLISKILYAYPNEEDIIFHGVFKLLDKCFKEDMMKTTTDKVICKAIYSGLVLVLQVSPRSSISARWYFMGTELLSGILADYPSLWDSFVDPVQFCAILKKSYSSCMSGGEATEEQHFQVLANLTYRYCVRARSKGPEWTAPLREGFVLRLIDGLKRHPDKIKSVVPETILAIVFLVALHDPQIDREVYENLPVLLSIENSYESDQTSNEKTALIKLNKYLKMKFRGSICVYKPQ